AGRPVSHGVADQPSQHHGLAAAYRGLGPELAGVDPDVAVDVGFASGGADLLDDVQEHHAVAGHARPHLQDHAGFQVLDLAERVAVAAAVRVEGYGGDRDPAADIEAGLGV